MTVGHVSSKISAACLLFLQRELICFKEVLEVPCVFNSREHPKNMSKVGKLLQPTGIVRAISNGESYEYVQQKNRELEQSTRVTKYRDNLYSNSSPPEQFSTHKADGLFVSKHRPNRVNLPGLEVQ